MSLSVVDHRSFELLRTQRVPSLNIEVAEYCHRATGARHFHLAAEDRNNAFLVAFPTVPQDSTGVAHILEHTTLCGSERFPVRDPFFMMSRRSLNTFMNAFTSSDWTAYPFASQNRKDFDNLLAVYLDAVFFPRLDELDFAQEGHRVEFERPDDSSTGLVYKGVVYNEMKGAMSSPVQTLWHKVQSHLFPTITYHHNSGGDPERIPDLSYAQLQAFHARHYHPSNALFLTYGDFPVAEHQQRIHELALRHFERQAMHVDVPDEQRFTAPLRVEEPYALDAEDDSTDKTHIVVAWLLGKVTDPREVMNAHLLSGLLLDNSSSPLRRALETCNLADAPSELCGLDDSTREMGFYAGLEGSNPEHADAVEDLILDVLRDVAKNGLPVDQLEAILHQIELGQREITGGGFPYGLRLTVNALAPAIHGGDPVQTLNIDPVLAELRSDIQDPEFVKGLVRDRLVENSHRVRVTMAPDTGLSDRKAEAERVRLAARKAAMDDAERRRVVERAAALQARQGAADDPEQLPKVGLEDVPAELKIATGRVDRLGDLPVTWFAQGTNGMVYQQIVVDLPQLDEHLLDLLPLFSSCVTEVGCGSRDYLEAQAWQAAVSGGIGARCSVRAQVADVHSGRGAFVLFGKALARNQDRLAELLHTTFHQARFDELSRLRELISQMRAHSEASVTDRGHSLALTAASAGMSPAAYLSHRWSGLAGLKALKGLDDALDDSARLKAFADDLLEIRDALLDATRQLVVVSEAERQAQLQEELLRRWGDGNSGGSPEAEDFALPAVQRQIQEAWTTSTQVNFCAKAYPTVAIDHGDAPALTVLGGFLRNGYLHTAVREQGGAYGAGAGYDSDSGSFRFYSYRDPRLAETLADFDGSLEWLQTADHEFRELEEAILGVIAQIDRPESPAGEALSAFFGSFHGRIPEQRRRFRARVLQVTLDDLKRVAESYLTPERASTAVVSDAKTIERQQDLGLQVYAL